MVTNITHRDKIVNNDLVLSSPDDVIDALDGPTELGKRLGVKPHTVSTWKCSARGVIPAEYSLLVADALASLDPPRRARPSVFNIIEPTP